MNASDTVERIHRYPDGRIPASRRYIDYDGQLVIRTRYGTIQRWVSEGWTDHRRPLAAYILGKDDCREREDLTPMNSHLAYNEFEVYYVETGETYRHAVEEDDR